MPDPHDVNNAAEANAPGETPIRSLVLDLLALAWREEQALTATLTPEERTAEGTPEHPSAKETIAGIAFWRAWQADKLAAARRGEALPHWREVETDEQRDARAESARRRAWSEVLDEAARAHDALVVQVVAMSEAELITPRRDCAGNDEPLWPETLGNGIWQVFTGLVALARRRGDAASLAHLQALQIAAYEQALVERERLGMEPEERGDVLYDMACFYAQVGKREQALVALADAARLRPGLAEYAKHDVDLESLRGEPAFVAITSAAPQSELITPETLCAALADAEQPLVIDVRDASEYAAGHVPGAVNIPLGELETRLAELPADRQVVTYCNMHQRGISRGERAAALLRDRGKAASTLDGGYPAWRAAGLPVEETARAAS
jgi:rhodanese-related sulfurtransferase